MAKKPTFAWTIDGDVNRQNDSGVTPGDARDWLEENFGQKTGFEEVELWGPKRWVKVVEGIYLLNWNGPETHDWTPLYLPHSGTVEFVGTGADRRLDFFRLAPKEHEAWKEKAPPHHFHSAKIELVTPLLERPAVQAGLGVTGIVIATGLIGRWLDWW